MEYALHALHALHAVILVYTGLSADFGRLSVIGFGWVWAVAWEQSERTAKLTKNENSELSSHPLSLAAVWVPQCGGDLSAPFPSGTVIAVNAKVSPL